MTLALIILLAGMTTAFIVLVAYLFGPLGRQPGDDE